MIRCMCCERHVGHSLAVCDCEGGPCPRCLSCMVHCDCESPRDESDTPVLIGDDFEIPKGRTCGECEVD